MSLLQLDELRFTTPYLALDDEFYDLCEPQPLEQPYLISFSPDAAKLIGLDPTCQNDERFVEMLNGTYMPKGTKYFAMCYAGHQFGNFVPRLGDGRALNLGKTAGWNVQLKGSGDTLYSRMADGRCALRSSIREYLMSEAMHHLGVPTTRALGIIGSQTDILRSRIEKGAIVMRLSQSWIRFGSFEYFYYLGEHEKLEQLAAYAIEESFSHLKDEEDRYYKMFSEVCERTAKLVAQWQGLGFNHGVMNTDNMSIAGLSIDYGPYAMLDDFEYNFSANKTDRAGRYAYGEQPNISYWNLTMLARALSPIISQERMDEKLKEYGDSLYPNTYLDEMREKMGLELKLEEDFELVTELVGMLQDAYVDNTLFFRTLSRYDGQRDELFDICMNPLVVDEWLNLYDTRLEKESMTHAKRSEIMLQKNPKYILKNYMLDQAIQKAERGDFSMIEELLYIAQHPFEELPEYEHFFGDTPEEHKNLRLSCSS
jgi:uncharacterized protein YdiU (UPF0061 family)